MKRLKALPGYRPDPVSGADAALNAAYKKLMDSSDEQYRKLLREAEREWIVYRDAETAFYEHRFADRFGRDAVAGDVTSRLSADRAKELAQPDH